MYPVAYGTQLERKLNVVDYTTYQSILFPVLSDWRGYWTTFDEAIGPDPGIALTSGEVASWTDQRNGFACPAVAAGQRPGYSADGTNFKGRSVVKCTKTGARALQGDFGSDLLSIGDRPYIIAVCAFAASLPLGAAAAHRFYETSNGTTTCGQALDAVQVDVVTTQTYVGLASNGSGVNTGNSTLTNNPTIHTISTTGTAGRYRRVSSGVDATLATAGAAAIVTACRRLTLGDRRIAGTVPADVNYAEYFVFRNYIGDALEARLLGAIISKWGI